MIPTTAALLLLSLSLSQAPQDPLQPRLEVHAVADLVTPGFPAAGPGAQAEPDESELRAGVERLVAIVREHVEPPLVEGRELVEPSGTSLVVVAREDQHRWIGSFLERQREARDERVSVRVHLLEGPGGSFAELLGGSSAAVVQDAEREALLQRAQAGDGGLELVTAPQVLTSHRRPVELSVTDLVHYVRAHRRRVVQPGDRELVYPVVESLQEGVWIDLLSYPLVGSGYVLEVGVRRSEVVRPIPTRLARVESSGVPAVEVGAGPAPDSDGEPDLREVAAPEERRVAFESSMVLASGAAMGMLASVPPAASEPERDLLVLITFDGPVPGDGTRGR